MSLYFDGFFTADLRPNTPLQVIETLQYLTGQQDHQPVTIPSHLFFEGEEWKTFLRPLSNWTCAPGWTGSEFKQAYRYRQNGIDVYRYTFTLRRTMHDDVEFNELWWSFLAWLIPYVETEGFIGYFREQYSEYPTLLYIKKGKLFPDYLDARFQNMNNEL